MEKIKESIRQSLIPILVILIIYSGYTRYQVARCQEKMQEQMTNMESMADEIEGLNGVIHDLKRTVIEQDEKIQKYQMQYGPLK